MHQLVSATGRPVLLETLDNLKVSINSIFN
jgi:hypothetical protein